MSELFVHRFGDIGGTAMLMLHGFMGSGRDWVEVAEKIGRNHNIIAPDLPGHGRSLFDEREQFTMESAAKMVIDVLDGEAIHECIGVGYSMGGRLLLHLAAHYPERFSFLVLESTSPGLADSAERARRKKWDAQKAAQLRSMPLDQFLRDWYDMPLFATFRNHPQFEQAFARRLNNDPEQLALSMEMMGTGSMEPLWHEWGEMAIPSVLVVGEHDAKYRRLATEMATQNELSTVEVVSGAGHNVHFERTDRFAALFEKYVP